MYIFCLKKPHKQKGKETKQENKNQRNQKRKGERKYRCCEQYL